MKNETLEDIDVCYGVYIPPFYGYKPKPLKWYQKIWYAIYNVSEYIMVGFIIATFAVLMAVATKMGYGRYVPVWTAAFIAQTTMFSIMFRH